MSSDSVDSSVLCNYNSDPCLNEVDNVAMMEQAEGMGYHMTRTSAEWHQTQEITLPCTTDNLQPVTVLTVVGTTSNARNVSEINTRTVSYANETSTVETCTSVQNACCCVENNKLVSQDAVDASTSVVVNPEAPDESADVLHELLASATGLMPTSLRTREFDCALNEPTEATKDSATTVQDTMIIEKIQDVENGMNDSAKDEESEMKEDPIGQDRLDPDQSTAEPDDEETAVNAASHKLRHVCTSCPRSFSRKRELVKHTYIHRETPPKLGCVQCSKIFTTETQQRRHNHAHHKPRVAAAQRQHVCNNCAQVFNSVKDLEKHHLAEHVEQKKFSCRICGATFSWREYLLRHETVHEVNPHTCDKCGREFVDQTSLRVHMRSHQKPPADASNPPTSGSASLSKRYVCNICNRAFQFDFSYRAHMDAHITPGTSNISHSSLANNSSLQPSQSASYYVQMGGDGIIDLDRALNGNSGGGTQEIIVEIYNEGCKEEPVTKSSSPVPAQYYTTNSEVLNDYGSEGVELSNKCTSVNSNDKSDGICNESGGTQDDGNNCMTVEMTATEEDMSPPDLSCDGDEGEGIEEAPIDEPVPAPVKRNNHFWKTYSNSRKDVANAVTVAAPNAASYEKHLANEEELEEEGEYEDDDDDDDGEVLTPIRQKEQSAIRREAAGTPAQDNPRVDSKAPVEKAKYCYIPAATLNKKKKATRVPLPFLFNCVMTTDKPFSCEYCGETFRWEISLDIHSKIHTDGETMPVGKQYAQAIEAAGAKKRKQATRTRKPLNKTVDELQALTEVMESSIVDKRASSDEDEDEYLFEDKESEQGAPSRYRHLRSSIVSTTLNASASTKDQSASAAGKSRRNATKTREPRSKGGVRKNAKKAATDADDTDKQTKPKRPRVGENVEGRQKRTYTRRSDKSPAEKKQRGQATKKSLTPSKVQMVETVVVDIAKGSSCVNTVGGCNVFTASDFLALTNSDCHELNGDSVRDSAPSIDETYDDGSYVVNSHTAISGINEVEDSTRIAKSILHEQDVEMIVRWQRKLSATRRAMFYCYCGSLHATKNMLIRHRLRLHRAETSFWCNKCDSRKNKKKTKSSDNYQRFTSWLSLLMHKRLVHAAHKIFCLRCGKGFRSGTDLFRHRRLHGGAGRPRSVRCETCDKLYCVASQLEQHAKTMHAPAVRPENTCQTCHKQFRTEEGYLFHQQHGCIFDMAI